MQRRTHLSSDRQPTIDSAVTPQRPAVAIRDGGYTCQSDSFPQKNFTRHSDG